MINWFVLSSIFYIVILFLRNAYCFYIEENINELKKVIDNDLLYSELNRLQDMLLYTIEHDVLKLPIKKDNIKYEYISDNFKEILIQDKTSNKNESYLVLNHNATVEDVINYEHILKEQVALEYDPSISDKIKNKILIVRTLKIVKFMLVPIYEYKKNKDIKQALYKLNNFFIYDHKKSKNHDYSTSKLKNVIRENMLYSSKFLKVKNQIPQNTDINEYNNDYKEILFSYEPDIEYMKNQDAISNYYDIGIYNHIGAHYIALGHFITLKMAFKHFKKYFVNGDLRFYTWGMILQFTPDDRFKALDLICDDSYPPKNKINKKNTIVKSRIASSSQDCSVLEFLIHQYNTYQIELFKKASILNLNMQIFLDTDSLKQIFFSFMCKKSNECNIYKGPQFKQENSKKYDFIDNNQKFSDYFIEKIEKNNPYSVYTNYYYFTKYYNEFNQDQVIYAHILNLIGILTGNSSAFVSSLYLPGYYNAIQLAYIESREIAELYNNLVKCYKVCYSRKSTTLKNKIKNIFAIKNYDNSQCSICEGALFYINNRTQDGIPMLQKYYNYITHVLNVNVLRNLTDKMHIYESYDNFLMHDLNWFTFLFLFRMTTYQDIHNNTISNAMFLNLYNETKPKLNMITFHWYPSYLKKFIIHYVRKNKAASLLNELESKVKKETIEKMKNSIRFVMHINSILQLDFFYYLNEKPLKNSHPYGLTMLIENKFKDWFMNYLTGFTMVNYDDNKGRYNLPGKRERREFLASKLKMWTLFVKKIITDAYVQNFNQKHVINLYKYHDIFNINNKIMVMRDSYELYIKKFDKVFFSGDVLIYNKFFSSTPKIQILKDRTFYYFHGLLGNQLNYYKFGILYAYTINKKLLKEIVEELHSIYIMNKNIFTEVSFMQTVRLLFKKIQHSFFSHRRNDAVSMNNIFFFNVRNNYSKLSKEERYQEIHESLASRFFEKTLFSIFHIMFVIKISKHVDKLDTIYGKANMLRMIVHEEPHLRFEYLYNNSMIDSLLNVFFPLYIKKPTVQLKYGKTFILANMFKLTSELFAIYNLNNLSMLCEYQAITGPNYYSFKKLNDFIDRKFVPIILFGYYKKLTNEIANPGQNIFTAFKGRALDNGAIMLTLLYKSIYMSGNLLYRNGYFFPNHLPEELQKQTDWIPIDKPENKPSAFYFDFQALFATVHGVSLKSFIYTLSVYYCFFDYSIFLFRLTTRIFDRFITVIDTYVNAYVRSLFNKCSIDVFLKALSKIYEESKKEGYYREIIESRIYSKEYCNNDTDCEFSQANTQIIEPIDISGAQYGISFFYKDSNIQFDDLDENELFLNDKNIINYENYLNFNQNNIDFTNTFNIYNTNEHKPDE
ncbi:cytoadherence linked asexual protein 9 [Plasmodium berghei]|uniref:Cytoadherence linked asexual protein 9 n=2 Tax=Plasmodium berghei TaxID=5821 RepID=A0A509APB1_PLABA|nr:cytoadherence linked asexual protein 9 [Plasmodium berghei ANKA]CXI37426.1 cytoadherence linked asexual protein 9 [Plasmodium berghei]SCM21670.1 cytoadherence linked asexual protein 9 [Plasmodium berghei]SCN24868.1 cytoadherence linked asexual protein 9 [Plasmodium berghei]SCO59982.1 cytoadherence linked asexual protein 9 [Plasmodium berghei]SCO61370.1 cytoadherence linked asexual protein 9 [Plasmodium berghei]|eukprot:XP_034421337.1 cytoadherence linked asexual protein 9 [Plasmodium berghei ANKA]